MLLLIVITVLSFLITFLVMPRLVRGLKLRGVLVRDYYKRKKTYIPREGGFILLFACGLMITLFPFVIYFTRLLFQNFDISFINQPHFMEINYFVVLVILMFGLFGMMDDYIDLGRPLKVILPIVFVVPIIFNFDQFHLGYMWLPFSGHIHLENTMFMGVSMRVLYKFMIIPVYIIVVSNLVNMHSGFNGLQSGLSAIILVTLLLKSINDGNTQFVIAIGGLTGAIVALWFFNRYPAQIFEGNTGALMIGAGIGLFIVIQGYLFSGFIMLIPHTINFLMYGYWRIKQKMDPKDKRYTTAKFGSIRKDGTLRVPNNLTLKWVLPYKHRMTEQQAVFAMYSITIVFCVLGFFVPG